MSWLEGIVLGLVQGLTEFLPISSSGHLVVAQRALGVRMPGVLVEVVLHVATLLAVCIVYWGRIVSLLRGAATGNREAWWFIGVLALATVPAALAGGLFAEFFEGLFESVTVVGVDFLITGCILWSTRWATVSERTEPSSGGALAIGIAQALAIFPGISRSGSTVAAGMWLRIDPVCAAEFSFLMAIPAIAGAAVLQIPDLGQETSTIGLGSLVASFVAALVAGVVAIRLLVRLLAHGAFHRFAPYCWALGLITLGWVVLA